MNVFWTRTAEITYAEEIDFIRKKWNEKQVILFVNLVEDFISILKTGVLIGRPYKIENVRISVISKQTTLVYKVYEKQNRIDLLLFWNNKKDPREFNKFLKQV